MNDKGKSIEKQSDDLYADYDNPSSDFQCRKHPSSSSVGICAYCLKERLIKLVCTDCGEQRLSSCSCSDMSSSYANSYTTDVGSVGRISFLIENERNEMVNSNSKGGGLFLKRSNSLCVDVKRNDGFWRFRKLFSKKREKAFDEKSEVWFLDCVGVSRSRSLCSFRGKLNDPNDSDSTFSGARASEANAGLQLDFEKKISFCGTEDRISSSSVDGGSLSEYMKKAVFDVNGRSLLDSNNKEGFSETGHQPTDKESDHKCFNESGFIDLKVDLLSESKPERFSSNMGGGFKANNEDEGSFGSLIGDRRFSSGSSYGLRMNERGIRKSRKSSKLWRWILGYNPSCKIAKKWDEDHVVRP